VVGDVAWLASMHISVDRSAQETRVYDEVDEVAGLLVTASRPAAVVLSTAMTHDPFTVSRSATDTVTQGLTFVPI
jgi:hypothetical protein